MKKFISITVLFFITNTISAQEEWHWQNPIPTSNALYCIKFLNDSIAFGAGDGGFLMKSSNQGLSWESINSGINLYLEDIFYIDANNFIAAGYGGKIIKSTDGGINWQIIYSTTIEYSDLKNIFFINNDTGFVCGSGMSGLGLMLKTTDGGETWNEIISNTYDALTSIHFFDPYNGLVLDYSTLHSTSDGGTTWNNKSTGYSGFRKMLFISSTIGYIIGENGLIIKTTDGGNTWEQKNSFTNKSLRALDIKDDANGIVVGVNGTILITTDSGESWSNISNIYSGFDNLYSTTINTEGVILSAGIKGELIRSTNNGFDWERIRQGYINNLNSICMINENKGWVVGDEGIILNTTNGGNNWIKYDSITNTNLRDILFISENEGWMVGDSGIAFRTNNNGQNWEPVNLFGNVNLNSIFFFNPDKGWIAGSNGSIYATTDGGNQWELQNSNTTDNLSSIFFTDEYSGWCVKTLGPSALLSTTNGGNIWNSSSNVYLLLYSIYFTNSSNGWIVGGGSEYGNLDYGQIFHTADGGASWQRYLFGYGSDWGYRFFDIYFLDQNRGWVIGRYLTSNGQHREGVIGYTTTAGTSLTFQRSSTANGLVSVSVRDESKVWVAGSNGTILYNSNSVVPVELINFSGYSQNGQVFLKWNTASELNNQRFEIERKLISENLASDWAMIGYKTGKGTSTKMNDYTFIDDISKLNTAVIEYRLKQIDYSGSFTYSEIVEIHTLPLFFSLSQNYPNPFNSITNIEYQIPNNYFVALKVYDVLGNEIVTLVNEQKNQGQYSVDFDASKLPSGVYFYRIQAGSYIDTKKMVLLR